MPFAYLVGLFIAICGLLVIDYRFKLAFWHDARRTSITVLSGVALFVIWDIFGISLGIFMHGNSPYALPPLVSEFPFEEIIFLFLLCYNALLLYIGIGRWQRT